MSTNTAEEPVPPSDSSPVYADLSQQFVPFEESDNSTASPGAIDEHPQEKHLENDLDNGEGRSAKSEQISNAMEDKAAEATEEGKEREATKVETRKLRKRNIRRGGGNGLCPPRPPQSVPVVNWTEPNEIKHIFPKTHNYVVCAQARYSSQYLTLSKWKKEFDFFHDKYTYWCDIIQNGQLSNPREVTKAKQLVGQLRWLLDHCWEGDESKSPVPEMLWRARKEETRRCEQLLIRKEYYKREAMKKKAAASRRRTLKKTAELGEEIGANRSCSPKVSARKSAAAPKRASEGAGCDKDAGSELKPPPWLVHRIKAEQEEQEDGSSTSRKEHTQGFKRNAYLFWLQVMAHRWNTARKQLEKSENYKLSATLNVLGSRLEKYVQNLVSAYEQISESDDFDEQLLRDVLLQHSLLKKELRDSGLEGLTSSWVIFESKSPSDFKNKAVDKKLISREPSKSPEKFPSPSSSSMLLKVRDYLDVDDAKSTATSTSSSRGVRSASRSKNTDGETSGTVTSIQSASGLAVNPEIARPVPIKPSSLTENERNRLELNDVVQLEKVWVSFAKTDAHKFKNDKPVLDAIEAVLNTCKSYRAVYEIALPKSIADERRRIKFLDIKEKVALLQTLIIRRHEAKTGTTVDWTPFGTPELIKFLQQRAAFFEGFRMTLPSPLKQHPPAQQKSGVATQTLKLPATARSSQNSDKQDRDDVPPKKKQKQQDWQKEEVESKKNEQEKELKLSKNENGIETLTMNRPKRHIKAPNRFIFDDEEKAEEEKRKKSTGGYAKVTRANTPKAKMVEEPKEAMQQSNSGRKRKSVEKSYSPIPPAESSDMETIVVIPEEDSSQGHDGNCCSTNNDDEMLLGPDVINVTAAHEFKCEPDGIIHDVYRYVAICNNGTTKEVSRLAYERWNSRKNTEDKVNSTLKKQSVQEESVNVGMENYATEKQQPISPEVAQQEQVPSHETAPNAVVNVTEQMVDRGNSSSMCGNDSSNSLLNTGTCSSRNTTFGGAAEEHIENGDYGPWRQVAFRKEASLNTPSKTDKLKTQYDHLLMIAEKNYVEKIRSEWFNVPEGGPFDDKIKHIRQLIQELEDVLNQPTSIWNDYFNLKTHLQTQIESVIVDFNALSGRAAPTRLPEDFNTPVHSPNKGSVSGAERQIDTMRPNSN